MTRRVVFHGPGGRTVTVHPHNKSSAGLSMFVHRATFKTRDAAGDNVKLIEKYRGQPVFNLTAEEYKAVKRAGGIRSEKGVWYKLSDFHVSTQNGDSEGAYLRPGSHRPETRAKHTPIDAVEDSYSHVEERDGKFYAHVNGKERGPYDTRAEAMQVKMGGDA
jgi:hypothetical protein